MSLAAAPPDLSRLRGFVRAFAALMEGDPREAEILAHGGELLGDLVAQDDWLPDDYARPDPGRYQQYLLHCDSRERFSVVSFVWAPGQSTPVHNHTVWGLVGVLRGGEMTQAYDRDGEGVIEAGPPRLLSPGQVERLSPTVGDIHRVWNAATDRPSVSVHVYGANIGAVVRSTFAADGASKRFVSGYANNRLPNMWAGSWPSTEGRA
jgi:predicted metal-dependent enzyme (double-stranded beta helix superfamily)